MTRTFICLLLTSCLSSCMIWEERSTVDHPLWLKGEWVGVALQVNSPETWTMELIVDGKNYNVRYPTLDCSGVWTLRRATAGRAEFLEVITYGQDRCINGGKVVITRVDRSHISYSYFSTQNGTVEAFSTLVDAKLEGTTEI